MKKLNLIGLLTVLGIVLSLSNVNAQMRRAATSASSSLSAVYPVNGSIEGSIIVQKADIPNTTNINQIAAVVQQGLKAFEFVPQNNGLLSDQYIHVSKMKQLSAGAQVSVQSSGDKFILKYAIQKVPLMRPMMVKLVGDAAKNIRFAVDPLLNNFPVAYLTSCDRTFECYNFAGLFIPYIK